MLIILILIVPSTSINNAWWTQQDKRDHLIALRRESSSTADILTPKPVTHWTWCALTTKKTRTSVRSCRTRLRSTRKPTQLCWASVNWSSEYRHCLSNSLSNKSSWHICYTTLPLISLMCLFYHCNLFTIGYYLPVLCIEFINWFNMKSIIKFLCWEF